VFTANMHTDLAAQNGWDAIVISAQARGVPVVSAAQTLANTDGVPLTIGSVAVTGDFAQSRSRASCRRWLPTIST